MSEETYDHDDVTCLRDTGQAVLVDFGDEEYWIPISQLREGNEIELEGDTGLLVCTQWIAEQKGLV